MRKKRKNINILDFEKGDGGISYAMYFVAVIIMLVMFVFLKFNADSYTLEQSLENGLHIAETGILTSSQDDVVNGYRADEYEKEIARLHIVSKYDNSGENKTAKEQAQLDLIGEKFSDLVQEQLDLNGALPNGDILKMMCGPSSKISISHMTIYEPVYTKTVTPKKENSNVGSSPIQKFSFDIEYKIVNWIEYDFEYSQNDNSYISVDKKILSSAPSLLKSKNSDLDNLAEGATIEATLSTTFNGVRNIFAGVSTNDKQGKETSFFSKAPTTKKYSIDVTQSSDITLMSLDSRQQN